MSKANRSIGPFVLDTETTFRWPVVVKVPDAANPGGKIKTQFTAEFKHVDQARRLELLKEHKDALEELKDAGKDEQIEGLFDISQRVLDEVLVGVTGVVDRDKKDVPFTPNVKRSLITHQMVWPAIFTAYNAAISQQDTRGN